jgi:hypothetical protein
MGKEKKRGGLLPLNQQEEGFRDGPAQDSGQERKLPVMMAGAAARKTPCRHTKTKSKRGKQKSRDERVPGSGARAQSGLTLMSEILASHQGERLV